MDFGFRADVSIASAVDDSIISSAVSRSYITTTYQVLTKIIVMTRLELWVGFWDSGFEVSGSGFGFWILGGCVDRVSS